MNAAEGTLPDSLKLDNQLCFSIYAASRAITRAYRPLLEPLGLTYPQFLVLLTLWESDGRTVNEIGRRLYLDSGTLTPVLKRMEQAGFVTRSRCCDDERRVRIWLTDQGRSIRQVAEHVPDNLAEWGHLDAEESRRTKVLVDQVLAKILDAFPDLTSI